MSAFKTIAIFVVPLLGVSALPQAFAHEEEILVGRTAAGELHLHMDFDQPVELPLSIFPGIGGYAFGELAFHSTVLDEPDEDLFQLSPTADFRFVLVAKDPGMEVWNDTGSGYMAINETFRIGPAPFDSHPIWNIVSGTPGNSLSLTLKLRDLNGVYPDSEPFVLSFTSMEVRPLIGIASVDALHVRLSWPTNAVGWELQSAFSATAANWSTVTNSPAVVTTNFALTITNSAQQQFFRLHKL